MLYAVIKRFDSLREITDSMFPEAPKLAQLGIGTMSRRSTLSDANTRRPETEFEDMHHSLKEGSIKMHTNIQANEGASDIKFTSAAANDCSMLTPAN